MKIEQTYFMLVGNTKIKVFLYIYFTGLGRIPAFNLIHHPVLLSLP